MRRDDTLTDAEGLVSLLCLWWECEAQWSPVRGYPHTCPSAHGYITSRQYDTENGAAETDARGREAKRIGAIVNAMGPLHRAALTDLARARATGVAVWRHPLLPADKTERAAVVARALDLFGMMV